MDITSRAQRLIDEFEEGDDVAQGLANVLEHLANAHDSYSDGDECWHGVTVNTLEELADELSVSLDVSPPSPTQPSDEDLIAAARAAVDAFPRVSELPYFLDPDSCEFEPMLLALRAAAECRSSDD